MKTFVLVTAAVLAGSLSAASHATAVRKVPHQVVSYADLDLDKPSDAIILRARIDRAARQVCGLRRVSLLPLEIAQRLEVCIEEAVERAIADVNAPLLTQSRQIVVRNVE